MTEQPYKTDSIEIAAYIAAKTGRRWSGHERRGRVWFYFEPAAEARSLRDEYMNGGCVVAQDFVDWRAKANQVIHQADA